MVSDRVALTIDGAAALARLTLQNVETLSAPQMSVFVDAVANHTKLFVCAEYAFSSLVIYDSSCL